MFKKPPEYFHKHPLLHLSWVQPAAPIISPYIYFVCWLILKIFSHLLMSRMLLSSSSSCVLVFLLFISYECNGRRLSTNIDDHAMDDKAKLASHSTIKGFGNTPFIVHGDLEMAKKEKDQTNTIDDDHHKQKDCGSKNKKEIKDPKVRKVKEDPVHPKNQPKFVTYRVPPKNKRVHQQPGFNLDYSPPKTHPPSHN